MLNKRILLIAMLCLLCLAVVVNPGGITRAALPAQELPLKPNGYAYEVNPDSNGILWVSDWYDGKAGEIRGINPLDGSYTVFPWEAGRRTRARMGPAICGG